MLLSFIFVKFICLVTLAKAKEDAPTKDFAAIHPEVIPIKPLGDEAKASKIGMEPYLISFHDHAESKVFDDTQKWLEGKNCNVTESVNESYIKFMVASMSKADVAELEGLKDTFGIESIEVDDLWDSKSEL